MKTIGEIAEALSRMDTLSHRLDYTADRLTRAMFPEQRATLLQQQTEWKAEYQQLYDTPLFPAAIPPTEAQLLPAEGLTAPTAAV